MKYISAACFILFGTFLFAEDRRILIVVSDHADPLVRQAAKTLQDVPLFAALKRSGGAVSEKPEIVSSESLLSDSAFNTAAMNNLVLVGLPDADPLMKKCLGHRTGLRDGRLNLIGYGKWKGDIGVVQCDWNPFLYSRRVKTNAFTTIIVRISGTSVAGVAEAVRSFRSGLLNGVVAAGETELIEPSILDRKPDFIPPPEWPETFDTHVRAGWTQPDETEYRAYIDLAGFAPVRLWRIKYLEPGVFGDVSGKTWVDGLDRLAYGNAVTIAEFVSEEEARKTWEAIGRRQGAARETAGTTAWFRFDQPTDEAFDKSYGRVFYYLNKNMIVASSLPEQTVLRMAARF